MISTILKNINILISYLQYFLVTKFRKPKRSSLLTILKDEIILDKRQFYAFDEIEKLKRELLANETLIQVDDYGAGSRKNVSDKRTVKEIVQSTSIPRKYGKLLFRMINYFQPKTILELGTGSGISTLYMAMPLKQAKVVTIEGSTAIAKLAQSNFIKMNMQNIHLLEGKFTAKLPEALDTLNSVDLIFIDGDHRKERLLGYFNTCLEYINQNSIIMVDDINWSTEMQEAWQQLSLHRSVTFSVDLFRLGILLFKPDLHKQQATLFY